ncbi:hypothetical protein BDV93DRAFT_607854 [Ceratobasidium sp. AG-I]|nr:hypothetical protein BDV93DRAFT_607854 [Ceratobasidium sp. AG-I]
MDSSSSTVRPRITPGRTRMWRASRTPSPPPSPPPRPDELKVFDPARQSSAHAIVATYYRVVFALIRGNKRRPGLPFELVIYIVRVAGLTLPYPRRDISRRLRWRPNFPDECGWGLERMPVKLIPMLKTASFTQDALRDISRVEVVVNFVENTQYYSADYWNKFYIGISERAKASKDNTSESSSKTLAWRCFDSIPSTTFKPMCRSIIGPKHKIWQYMRPGDFIEISVMTKALLSPKDYCEAVIRVYKKWEPSSEMLQFC